MSFTRVFPLLAFATSMNLAPTVWADDASLYAEPAPADAAFVRFIGFEPGASVEFEGVRFTVPDEKETSYVAVSSARMQATQSGAFVSVLPGQTDGLDRIDEPAREGRSRVHLIVVNASSAPVHLRTADGAMAVVEDVAPGASASRAVNPVSVSLGLFGAEAQALDTFDVALRRGQNLSFVVDEHGVRLIENSFGPVLK